MVMPHALEGLRVLDFSWFGAGPMGTKVLADHGAEVIRVESIMKLDGLRMAPPFPPTGEGPNLSGYYNNHNSSKLSVTLNMQRPEARDIALRLVAVSDVVIDNFNPGILEKWGLAYERLVEVKSDIIQIRMPMLGLTGPHRHWIGFGMTLTGLCGFNELSGFPNREPAGIGTNYPDYSSNPYHAMFAILSALHWRRRTGEGQFIELSQYESTINILHTAVLDYTVNGREATRRGNRSDIAAPHGAYPCMGEDRWIAIACENDAQWAALVEHMGFPDWALEARFATLVERVANADALDDKLAEWTRDQRAEDLMWKLQRAGVPAGVVENAQDTLENDAQLRFREHFQRLEHPEAGVTYYDAPPVRLSKTPGRLRSPAPLLGQHNGYVFGELLGMSEDEIRRYTEEGIFA
ncbi:MAG TPA: CoA transferase [Dehalococcoidia bacterium]|nr:CoA transferase [Dehalococcoidia bacterium]